MLSLVPWKKKGDKEIEDFRKDLNDLWDRFFGETPWALEPLGEKGFRPKLDMSEKKDRVIVKVELPGIEAQNVNVSLTNNILTIKGERKQEKEDKDESFHRVERYYGAFRRDVELPCEVVTDKIQATHKNGVLTIDLPKSDKAKIEPVKIKIH